MPGEYFLQRQPLAGGVGAGQQRLKRHALGRAMDYAQRLVQSGHTQTGQVAGRDQVRKVVHGILKRVIGQLAQPWLGDTLGSGVNRGQAILYRGRFETRQPAVFGMHDFQAPGALAHLAVAQQAGTRAQAGLLLAHEVKETQRDLGCRVPQYT